MEREDEDSCRGLAELPTVGQDIFDTGRLVRLEAGR